MAADSNFIESFLQNFVIDLIFWDISPGRDGNKVPVADVAENAGKVRPLLIPKIRKPVQFHLIA